MLECDFIWRALQQPLDWTDPAGVQSGDAVLLMCYVSLFALAYSNAAQRYAVRATTYNLQKT